MSKKAKEQIPPDLKETIRIRAGILKQKFSRDVDFEKEKGKSERLHVLRSTVELSILEFIEAMKPVHVGYEIQADSSREDQSITGRFGLTLIWKDKNRSVWVPFTVFYNREFNVIEMTGYQKNVVRSEFPLDVDPEEMKGEITVSLTNLLIELIQA